MAKGAAFVSEQYVAYAPGAAGVLVRRLVSATFLAGTRLCAAFFSGKGLPRMWSRRSGGGKAPPRGSHLLVAFAVLWKWTWAAQLRSSVGREERELMAVLQGKQENGGEDLDSVCDPPCVPGRGVCDNNTCFCRSGFTGSTCQLNDKSGANAASVEAGVAVGILVAAVVLGAIVGKLFFGILMGTCCAPTQYDDDNIQAEIWKPLGD